MKNRGFTLIELMLVVALISFLSVMGFVSLRDRFDKNEVIKVKAGVPTLLSTGTLRVYEKAISGAALQVNDHSISIPTLSGADMELRSSRFTFSTSPAAIGLGINTLGGFENNFDILVKDKKDNLVMTFKITTKSNFGVFRIDVSEP